MPPLWETVRKKAVFHRGDFYVAQGKPECGGRTVFAFRPARVRAAGGFLLAKMAAVDYTERKMSGGYPWNWNY